VSSDASDETWSAATHFTCEVAALTDPGTQRPDNEDNCGSYAESSTSVVFAVADGVGGYEGGELASRMAIDTTLSSYRESPTAWGASKRLYRAVQEANIAIYDRAIVVPELRRMATTLTAVAVDRGELTAAHVGDSRCYLIRDGQVTQLTKDHTIVGERLRLGLISADRARLHPDRSTLTRSVGAELIVAIDKITHALQQGDVILVCSDGLYNVLDDRDFPPLIADFAAPTAARNLIDAANARGTIDNLTAVLFRMTGTVPSNHRARRGLSDRVRSLFGK
jgi:protein phosphatase